MPDNAALMINGAEWIMVEKKGVIFTPWQLVAHTVNLKSEDHTRGHFLKSSHTCWKIKKGLFGAISLFSIDYTRRVFTMEFKTLSKRERGTAADISESRR